MLLGARQFFAARKAAPTPLPYDSEVEWVKAAFNSQCYIDTGYAATTNTGKIVAKYDFSATGVAYSVWGANAAGDTKWFANQYNNRWWFGTTGNLFGGSQGVGMHEVEWNWNNGSVSGSVNGTAYSGSYSGTLVSGASVYLFAVNNAGSPSRQTPYVRIYSWKLWDDGVVVRDMIPVRVGSVGCMYDRANKNGGPNSDGLYFPIGSVLYFGNDKQ
jgi:hypothetical protein